ncbi:MAG: DUF192 domain-containing protein [Myxococcaceae bacterium]|nr:DUF192 domain-containing protein [Myxococcaceae bacterium]
MLGACTADGDNARSHDEATVPARRPTSDVTAKDWVGPPLPRAKVILTDAFGGRHLVEVEVAATGPMRQRGLMWREHLDDGKGMLFVFRDDQIHNFWMRNTLIPLDMLFIDKDGQVVGIVRNAEPRTLTSRSVGKPSRYVLEVPGGWCEKNAIEPGAKTEFEGLSLIAVE